MSGSPTTDMQRVETLLRERFGLRGFRPGQREVIDALLLHAGALAVFPTGGGKSLCYQLPALLFEGVTLVVSPLIALMKDQIDALARLGIAAARLDSSLPPAEADAVTERMRAGVLKLVYVAPERFNNERFLADLEHTRISLFAIDEAHCISEWGHNFRPDYLKLAETARKLGVERVLALTATATPQVVEDICGAFEISKQGAIVTGFYRPNLHLLTTPVTALERDALLRSRIESRPRGSTIVYVTLQRTAEELADRLIEAGVPARAYHAGMEAEARSRVQEWWKASNENVVVATIAFGMGIDKADVRYVYHYNLPKSLESYSQEIGRAGRDGAPSIVELLACPDDVAALENFAYGDTPTGSALTGLLTELMAAGPSFDVALTELSSRHDIRPLVLRTALTYLELAGVIAQGTPFYAGYEARPLVPLETIAGAFQGERASFIERLFGAAKRGRIWYGFRPEALAATLREPRARIVSALQYLAEKQRIELRASDVRHRYTRLRREEPAALARELAIRFQRREEQEIARLGQVLAIVRHAGCQTLALAAHFGEHRAQACGHCGYCDDGVARALPDPRRLPPIDGAIDQDEWSSLCAKHPRVLGEHRAQARLLCGLSSPALTQSKLSRHRLFGALDQHRFADVLAWCEASR